ncbi:MAG TPA: hypothetical protein VGN34_33150 [Ktedonobacteraceae bacterium]|jgi:hypothetical protein
MSPRFNQAFSLSSEQRTILRSSTDPWFPEWQAVADNPEDLSALPSVQTFLSATGPLINTLGQIPKTSYSLYYRPGSAGYTEQYRLKRTRLSAAALHFCAGHDALTDAVHDYLWSICEESSWVVPEHIANKLLEPYAVQTALLLAEVVFVLQDRLDSTVRARVGKELELRIFRPYLADHGSCWWYKDTSSWNGICNSAIAATALLFEPYRERALHMLDIALDGLNAYLEQRFEQAAVSPQHLLDWYVSLENVVIFSELLYARSAGSINLLQSERIRSLAGVLADLAEFEEEQPGYQFHSGVIARLLQRTHEDSLHLLLKPGYAQDWRFGLVLRDLLWQEEPLSVPQRSTQTAGAGVLDVSFDNAAQDDNIGKD